MDNFVTELKNKIKSQETPWNTSNFLDIFYYLEESYLKLSDSNMDTLHNNSEMWNDNFFINPFYFYIEKSMESIFADTSVYLNNKNQINKIFTNTLSIMIELQGTAVFKEKHTIDLMEMNFKGLIEKYKPSPNILQFLTDFKILAISAIESYKFESELKNKEQRQNMVKI